MLGHRGAPTGHRWRPILLCNAGARQLDERVAHHRRARHREAVCPRTAHSVHLCVEQCELITREAHGDEFSGLSRRSFCHNAKDTYRFK